MRLYSNSITVKLMEIPSRAIIQRPFDVPHSILILEECNNQEVGRSENEQKRETRSPRLAYLCLLKLYHPFRPPLHARGTTVRAYVGISLLLWTKEGEREREKESKGYICRDGNKMSSLYNASSSR